MASISLFKWNTDNKDVLLVQENGQLFLSSGTTQAPLLLGKKVSLDYVKSCYPVFADGMVHLAKQLKEWVLQERTIRLLKSGNSMLWQLFYTKLAKAYNFPIDPDSTRSVDDHAVSLAILNVSQLPSFLLEKIILQSELDCAVSFDQDNWAITMLNSGDTYEGHAVIAIEGVDKTVPFFRYIHLRGKLPVGTIVGMIVNECSTGYRYSVFGKTQTWLRTRKKVEKLIARVNLEMEHQKGPMPLVYFNMLGSFIGKNPVSIGKFISFDDFVQKFISKCPFTAEIILLRGKGGDAQSHEFWVGEKKTMFIRWYQNGKGPVELFINPDNCLSYAVRKLAYADIEINNYEFFEAVTPKSFASGSTSSYFSIVDVAQERVVIPIWIERMGKMAKVFRADFTDEIQRQVGKGAWKLTGETVSRLDQWRWYPDVGTGSASLRTLLRVEKDEDIIVCFDNRDIKEPENSALHFRAEPKPEMLASLISVEDLRYKRANLIISVETTNGRMEIDLRDECIRQFIELGIIHFQAVSLLEEITPEANVEGSLCNLL